MAEIEGLHFIYYTIFSMAVKGMEIFFENFEQFSCPASYSQTVHTGLKIINVDS